MSEKYISASQEAGRVFYQSFQGKGPVVMLNLLRFNATADYSEFPQLAPDEPISGQEAYELYIKHTLPLLEKVGAKVLFQGTSNQFLIGPTTEKWDLVLLVQHPSLEVFMTFANNPEYLKTYGHRTAALEDSRLLPMLEK